MRISSKTQEQDGITCGKEEKMADKKLVEAITSMNEDFAQWYTDVVKKAELIDYSNVKGCMVIKPAGYAIWESIQRQLDERFKAVGVENVYMPMFIPESLLNKEKDHVEGFAPEVAWVTHGGLEELQERMQGRTKMEVVVLGEKEQAEEILQGIGQIISCMIEPAEESGSIRIELDVADNADIRKELSVALAGAGMPILSMNRQERTLEDIFLELTGEAAQEEECMRA